MSDAICEADGVLNGMVIVVVQIEVANAFGVLGTAAIGAPGASGGGDDGSWSVGFVLFCFVWLATLGVPVVASGTAAGTFRRVVEAP